MFLTGRHVRVVRLRDDARRSGRDARFAPNHGPRADAPHDGLQQRPPQDTVDDRFRWPARGARPHALGLQIRPRARTRFRGRSRRLRPTTACSRRSRAKRSGPTSSFESSSGLFSEKSPVSGGFDRVVDVSRADLGTGYAVEASTSTRPPLLRARSVAGATAARSSDRAPRCRFEQLIELPVRARS